MDFLIKNCRVVSPGVDIACGAIAVKDGKVAAVYENGDNLPETSEVIDAAGKMAVPGFIDLHFHGAGGNDVCDGSAEGIEIIAKMKMEEGTTTICPTTLTLSEEQLTGAMKAVAEYKADEKYSKVAGVHLEGPFVNQAAAGAQNPDFIRLPDVEEVKRLNEISNVSIISYAPEMEGGIEFTKQLKEIDVVPSAGHSKATYAQIKEACAAGLKNLTHYCNQMSPLHHREIGMVGAGIMEKDLLIEVICDKIHLREDMLRFVFQCKNLDRIAVITDALAVTGLPDGDYDLGGLPIYLKDGAARLKDGDNLAGSTLRMNKALKNIQEVTGLPLKDIVQTTSYNQAVNLGLDNLGKIQEGYIADLVLLDADYNVDKVIVDGVVKVG